MEICAGCGIRLPTDASFVQEMGVVCEACHLKAEQSFKWRRNTLVLGRLSAVFVAVDVVTTSLFDTSADFIGAIMAGVFFYRLKTKDPDHQAEVAQITPQDKLVAGLALTVSLVLAGIEFM